MTFSHFMCHCKWYCTDHPAVTCHQSTAVTTDQTRVEATITHTVDGLSCRPACRWWWAANRSSRDLWQIKIQLIIVSKLIATVMGPVWGNMILNINDVIVIPIIPLSHISGKHTLFLYLLTKLTKITFVHINIINYYLYITTFLSSQQLI